MRTGHSVLVLVGATTNGPRLLQAGTVLVRGRVVCGSGPGAPHVVRLHNSVGGRALRTPAPQCVAPSGRGRESTPRRANPRPPRRGVRAGLWAKLHRAVLHLAFAGLGAQSATSIAFTDNPASLAISRKLGYEPDGIACWARSASHDLSRWRSESDTPDQTWRSPARDGSTRPEEERHDRTGRHGGSDGSAPGPQRLPVSTRGQTVRACRMPTARCIVRSCRTRPGPWWGCSAGWPQSRP